MAGQSFRLAPGIVLLYEADVIDTVAAAIAAATAKALPARM
jgi:hypothetical protein